MRLLWASEPPSFPKIHPTTQKGTLGQHPKPALSNMTRERPERKEIGLVTPGDSARSRICLWASLALHNHADVMQTHNWRPRRQRSPQASYEADKAFLTRFACQGHRIKFISLKPQAVPSPPMPLGFYYGVWEKGTARRVGRGRSLLPGGRLREAEGRGWGGGSPREERWFRGTLETS